MFLPAQLAEQEQLIRIKIGLRCCRPGSFSEEAALLCSAHVCVFQKSFLLGWEQSDAK